MNEQGIQTVNYSKELIDNESCYVEIFGIKPENSTRIRAKIKKITKFLLEEPTLRKYKSISSLNEDGFEEDYYMAYDLNNKILIHKDHSRGNDTSFVNFLYPEEFKAIALTIAKRFAITTKETNDTIHLLIESKGSGLDLASSKLRYNKVDISLSYGERFKEFHNNIVPKLRKNSSGILLLHGTPGTGKTSYIKYLTKVVSNRKFIIVPNSLIKSISSPSFIPFMLDHKDSVLVFEDAEEAVKSRENGGYSAVSELLNLSDGLIGAALNCSIIVTFNTELSNIDPALMRKGRLIGEYKFDKLTIDESNLLLKKLGKITTATEPMLLTDIYNSEETIHKSQRVSRSVGFTNKWAQTPNKN